MSLPVPLIAFGHVEPWGGHWLADDVATLIELAHCGPELRFDPDSLAYLLARKRDGGFRRPLERDRQRAYDAVGASLYLVAWVLRAGLPCASGWRFPRLPGVRTIRQWEADSGDSSGPPAEYKSRYQVGAGAVSLPPALPGEQAGTVVWVSFHSERSDKPARPCRAGRSPPSLWEGSP